MSKRKKKLYAKKYQPWFQKKDKAAASMEYAILQKPKRSRGASRLMKMTQQALHPRLKSRLGEEVDIMLKDLKDGD